MKMPPLTQGRILKRYKRFLADVELASGERVIAHCANTGPMTGCWEAGAKVEMSFSDNPKRKLPWSLERIDMGGGWIGVNTARTNSIIGSFLLDRQIIGLEQFDEIRAEPPYLAEGFPASRFDFLLKGDGLPDCYVEVKNTTYLVGDQIQFPDTVTERGRKHLQLLTHAAKVGHRAVMLYAVNRPEGNSFSPAWEIDPAYGAALKVAMEGGVEVLAVRVRHTAKQVRYGGLIPDT